jgi:hypothetical protein
MSCKNPLNLPDDTGTRPNQARVSDRIENRDVETGVRTRNGTEGIVVDDYVLQMLLARVFGPEVEHSARSLDEEASSSGRPGFEEAPRAVPNSVLFPLAWNELVARVSGALRHPSAVADSRVAKFGDIQVDLYEMAVSRFGKPVVLTTQEFKTLRFLVLNPRRVISRNELLNQAWGYENYPSTRTVDNHIMKLRQKLETDPSRPMHFQTVHGTGYKFVP